MELSVIEWIPSHPILPHPLIWMGWNVTNEAWTPLGVDVSRCPTLL